MTTPERARRRVQIFALLIALGFGGLAFASWWSGRDNPREGSVRVAEGGPRLVIDSVPRTYRAVYRVESRAAGDLVVNIERVWVRRPFASRVETYRDGRRQTVRQSAFGVLTSVSSGGAEPLNITVPPSLSSGDLRIDAVLDEAVETRTMLPREKREVFGRRCQVYRAGSSVLAGDLEPYEAGKGEYADICVDSNGIILEEYWVSKGEPLRRRVVTDLEVDRPIDEDLFRITVREDPKVDRGAVERIPDEIDSDGIPLWTLRRAPDGFDSIGRYAVVISGQALPQIGGQQIPIGVTSTADVYVRGPDLLVIDQDPSLAQRAGLESRTSRDVELGRLRNGQLVVDARMNEVRGQTPDGSFVRVFGTLPTDELVAIARDLRPDED